MWVDLEADVGVEVVSVSLNYSQEYVRHPFASAVLLRYQQVR